MTKPSSVPAVRVSDLSASYRHHTVLDGVSFAVPQGVVLGIVGPNGAGKSTLLKAMLGLLPDSTGEVHFLGAPLSRVRARVSYMPQSLSLDPTFPVTVTDVVLMGTYPTLGWLKRPRKAHRERARQALELVALEDLATRPIGELSGGQRQRVLLARALVQEPELLIMDEPFQGVDAASERKIVEVLKGLRQRGVTVLMVHHDLMTVLEYCDWVALVNRGVAALGPADTTFTAENIERVFGIPNLAHGQSASVREEQERVRACSL